MYITSNNNKNMSRNSFQITKKPVVEEFLLKSVLFPELPELHDNNKVSSINTINYKNALLEPVPENFIPIVRIKVQTEYELELAKKRVYHNEACKVIDVMSKKWLDFRLNYIEMWSEDEYERWYIPLSDWDKAIFGEDDDESDIESSEDEENCDY